MSIYEYRCPACGVQFEVRHEVGSRELVRCPKCKSPAERRYSLFNFNNFPIKAVRLNGEEIR